jgi:hypothetical protein
MGDDFDGNYQREYTKCFNRLRSAPRSGSGGVGQLVEKHLSIIDAAS